MKTTQRQNKPFSGARKKKDPSPIKEKHEDELIVIRDVSNGKEYYLSVVDTFLYAKREYVVMYNYVPDDGNHADPELVIMRTEFSEKGDQRFYSIKDKDELEVVFSYFMRRYYNSSVPGKKDRVGINFKGEF